MNSLLLIAPLFVFALVVLLGFAGCWLDSEGTAVDTPRTETEPEPEEPEPEPEPVPYAEAVTSSNPIAYWRLSDVTGSAQAKDEIGQPPDGDHPGTYQGNVVLEQPGLLESEPGATKAQFDGTGTVDIPNAQIFETASFTVEALVHPDVISDPVHVIVRNMSPAGGWALGIVPSDDPAFDGVLEARGNDGINPVDLPFPVSLGELGTAWHVAMTYDSSTGIAVLYKDGLEVAGAGVFPYVPNTLEPLQIGLFFKGAIQEVAVYGVALTKFEIADHYTATQAEL